MMLNVNRHVKRTMIDIFFPINPKPIQSTKFARLGKFTKTYQPKDNVEYKGQIRHLAKIYMEENSLPIISKAVRIIKVEYRFPPLKSFSKRKLSSLARGNILYKESRPDLMDNLNKGFFDALQSVLYTDDSLIVESLLTRKIYSLNPGIHLVLEEI